MSGLWRKSVAVLTLAVSLLSSASVAADEAFEQPPLELDAALIVPDELMVGEGYKIDALVVNDGAAWRG